MTYSDLAGKVAIVTGASRGIGEAIAKGLADEGVFVVISGRKESGITRVATEINDKHPGAAVAVVAHAGHVESANSLVESAVSHFGRLDIAVNNAATNPHFGSFLDVEEWQWDKILEVNVKGTYWLCQAAAKQMKRQGNGGKIINIASIAGIEPGGMMGVYSVSKAAIIMLTKVLALELGPDGIQVNAIAPGFVKTRFSQALWDNPAINESIINKTPAGRMATVEEIAGIANYLASPVSDFTTGSVIVVDGGYTLT